MSTFRVAPGNVITFKFTQNKKVLDTWPFLTMTMSKIPGLPWLNGQNWSILTIDHGKFHVVMVMVNYFDH